MFMVYGLLPMDISRIMESLLNQFCAIADVWWVTGDWVDLSDG